MRRRLSSLAEEFLNHAFLTAVARGDMDEVVRLHKRGARINIIDAAGETPLMKASWCAQPRAVAYLLEQGAEINHQNNNGNTALHFLAARSMTGMIAKAVSAGGRIDVPNIVACLPIHYALKRETAGALLEAGAKPDAQDGTGRTPLMRAGDDDLFYFLLGIPQDLEARDNDGRTVLVQSLFQGEKERALALVKAGASIFTGGERAFSASEIAARECGKDFSGQLRAAHLERQIHRIHHGIDKPIEIQPLKFKKRL